jgi:hypothetical protein
MNRHAPAIDNQAALWVATVEFWGDDPGFGYDREIEAFSSEHARRIAIHDLGMHPEVSVYLNDAG